MYERRRAKYAKRINNKIYTYVQRNKVMDVTKYAQNIEKG